MFRKLLLTFTGLCCLSSCITFNTGAKLDSIGKAVPINTYREEESLFEVNGVVYQEIMVEYRQQNPKLMGFVISPHYINTRNPTTPAPDDTGAPTPELYHERLDNKLTNDMPVFIKAIDFDYTKAKRVNKDELAVSYMDRSHFTNKVDFLTLTPSQYDTLTLEGLPTIRTTGNKLRLPLAVALSYGVDLPLTAVGYAVGTVLHLIMIPIELLR